MIKISKKRRQPTVNEPFAAKPRDSVREWLETCLERLPELEVRRMFGGAGIYAEGTMFGILDEGRVYLKTNEVTRTAFIERGTGPFRAAKNMVLKSYYELPTELLDDEDEFLAWARQGLEVAKAVPAKSKGPNKVSPSRILEGHAPKLPKGRKRRAPVRSRGAKR